MVSQESEPEGSAFNQLIKKNYAEKHKALGLKAPYYGRVYPPKPQYCGLGCTGFEQLKADRMPPGVIRKYTGLLLKGIEAL